MDSEETDVSLLTVPAGEAIKKVMGGEGGNEDGEKKDSGIDVGGILSKVTGGNDDNGGGEGPAHSRSGGGVVCV